MWGWTSVFFQCQTWSFTFGPTITKFMIGRIFNNIMACMADFYTSWTNCHSIKEKLKSSKDFVDIIVIHFWVTGFTLVARLLLKTLPCLRKGTQICKKRYCFLRDQFWSLNFDRVLHKNPQARRKLLYFLFCKKKSSALQIGPFFLIKCLYAFDRECLLAVLHLYYPCIHLHQLLPVGIMRHLAAIFGTKFGKAPSSGTF